MRRNVFGPIGLILLLVALGAAPAGTAHAAAVVDVDNIRTTESGHHPVIPVTVTGDTNSVTLTLAAYPWLDGHLFYAIETEPGTGDEEPTAAFDVTVASAHWSLTWAAMSNTADDHKAFNEAAGDTANYPMVTGTVTVTVGDLGADNTATVYLIFW